MGPFEMVVYIVLICTAGGIIGRMMYPRSANGADPNVNARYQRRGPWGHRHHGGPPPRNSESDIKPHVARIDALEERIRVLERIVTDKTERLKRELDELED